MPRKNKKAYFLIYSIVAKQIATPNRNKMLSKSSVQSVNRNNITLTLITRNKQSKKAIRIQTISSNPRQ